MSVRLHFGSGSSGVALDVLPDSLRGPAEPYLGGVSLLEEARAHAASQTAQFPGETPATSFSVSTLAEVHRHLRAVHETGAQVSFLDFHSHGGPGSLSIGSELLRPYHWPQFEEHQSAFASNARIEFHGCNVAEDDDGEIFLVKCAWHVLRPNGGTAVGHRGYALSTRAWGLDTSTPSYLGGEVVAEIASGGHPRLHNAIRLVPSVLRAEADDFERLAQRRLARCTAAQRQDLTRVLRLVGLARRDTHAGAAYTALYGASQYLRNARSLLRSAGAIPPTPLRY
ncbi:MAG: DUF4347 domain-containing protein [Sandaracinaceae bacterium]|nr:DUF4347 domain-containing protein [Sandaracinaceae bacterium]